MKIALVSDSHLSPKDRLLASNWAATLNWVAAEAPDLTVHLGDITANGDRDPGELDLAAAQMGAIPGYWRVLPGNHDVGDNPRPVPERLERFSQIFGADHWRIDWMNWRLIGLNAQLINSDLAEERAQLDWLRKTAADWTGPIGLFSHKPFYPMTPEGAALEKRYAPEPGRTALLEPLLHGDLRFIASGHVHQSAAYERDGVDNIWAPSCGFTIAGDAQLQEGEKRPGAALLELTPGRHQIRFCAPEGLVPVDGSQLVHLYPETATTSR